MPKSPWSFGWHIMLYLVSLYFFSDYHVAKINLDLKQFIFLRTPFGTSKKDSINMGKRVSTELISTNLPPTDKYFPF
jgi:hypothetical protein